MREVVDQLIGVHWIPLPAVADHGVTWSLRSASPQWAASRSRARCSRFQAAVTEISNVVAICSAVSHMNNMSGMDAAYAEAFVGGIVNTQPAARERLEAFANKTAARVRPNS